MRYGGVFSMMLELFLSKNINICSTRSAILVRKSRWGARFADKQGTVFELMDFIF